MYNKTISKGQFLIANPSIDEAPFNQTVILITEHSLSGTIGYIINKPLNYRVNEIISSLSCNFRVYFGGPIESNNLYFIHSRPDLIANSIKINEQIYWSGEYEDVKRVCSMGIIKDSEIIFLLGYVGWKKNQLEKEVIQKNWSIDSRYINLYATEDKNNLWQEKTAIIRKESVLWLNIPANPGWN